ncbi:MAG TPA: VOC family protein [Solirubrobacteraceae bacterium]|nr:VOC family protein [Solirubrobacteraceae bacterium]
MEAGPETSRITHLFAGVPVSDLDASIDWYTRLFGRPPDHRVGHEMLWEMDEHAWLFIEPNAPQAGAGRITLAVSGLDALLERVEVEGIEHEPIETYSNDVRHVKIPDPDGNAIAFAEPLARLSPHARAPRAQSHRFSCGEVKRAGGKRSWIS